MNTNALFVYSRMFEWRETDRARNVQTTAYEMQTPPALTHKRKSKCLAAVTPSTFFYRSQCQPTWRRHV